MEREIWVGTLTQCGPHVQAVSRLLGYPMSVQLDELLDESEQRVAVEHLGDGKSKNLNDRG